MAARLSWSLAVRAWGTVFFALCVDASIGGGSPYPTPIPRQHRGFYAPPAAIQNAYSGPTQSNTPVVVLGKWAYVGTDSGVVGANVLGRPLASEIADNPAPFVFATDYPVTTLWNTSLSEMVAVANDTLHGFKGSLNTWNFTIPGFQFDFQAEMGGQYPTPLVHNGSIILGTRNCNYDPYNDSVSGSWVFSIDVTTGRQNWATNLSASYTNFQIQLSDDLQTLAVRASTPFVSTEILLLDAATGEVLPFAATTLNGNPDHWVPQFSVFNGTLWINDNCEIVSAVNITSGATTVVNLGSANCAGIGFRPTRIGGIVMVATVGRMFAMNATSYELLSEEKSLIAPIHQVMTFTPTITMVCGPNGLQAYDLGSRAFAASLFFLPRYAVVCDGLTWSGNGLLVASFRSVVYGINVSAGTVTWQLSAEGLGAVSVLPTASGNYYTMANSVAEDAGYANILTWTEVSTAEGWVATVEPASFAHFGAPFDVIVVHSSRTANITVLAAGSGRVLAAYKTPTGFTALGAWTGVGDRACINGNVSDGLFTGPFLYCVPLSSAGKSPFGVAPSSPVSSLPSAVSGSVLYAVSEQLTVEYLDTAATVPTFASLVPPGERVGPVPSSLLGIAVGADALGKPMVFGSGPFRLFGIKVPDAHTILPSSWLVDTYFLVPGDALYDCSFLSSPALVAGDPSAVLVVGALPPPNTNEGFVYGLMSFAAANGSLRDMYLFPSVREPVRKLEVDQQVVLLAGTNNLTACSPQGGLYWSSTLDTQILATRLQLAAGALFVIGMNSPGSTLYAINAFTGHIAWWSSSSAYWTQPAVVVGGLAIWGVRAQTHVARLLTGQLVATFRSANDYSDVPRPPLGGNMSAAVWVFGASGRDAVFGAPISGAAKPSTQQAAFEGTFPSAPSSTLPLPSAPLAPPPRGPDLGRPALIVAGVTVPVLLVPMVVVGFVLWRKQQKRRNQREQQRDGALGARHPTSEGDSHNEPLEQVVVGYPCEPHPKPRPALVEESTEEGYTRPPFTAVPPIPGSSCVRCRVSPPSAVLIGCGHVVVCPFCAPSMIGMPCPICGVVCRGTAPWIPRATGGGWNTPRPIVKEKSGRPEAEPEEEPRSEGLANDTVGSSPTDHGREE